MVTAGDFVPTLSYATERDVDILLVEELACSPSELQVTAANTLNAMANHELGFIGILRVHATRPTRVASRES